MQHIINSSEGHAPVAIHSKMASYHLQHSRTNIGFVKLPCMTQNALEVVFLGNRDIMQRGFGIELLHTDALVCEDGLLKLHLLAQ